MIKLLDKCQLPKSNVSKKELRALKGLKKDESREIVTADKGDCFVVMDKSEYEDKCLDLLKDTSTYSKITDGDPSARKHKELCKLLKGIKDKGELSQKDYSSMQPPGKSCVPPKFYGLPKIHKLQVPMRPIVSSIGSLTYSPAKFVAKIIKSLAGKNIHHVESTKQFVEKVCAHVLRTGEIIVSFDVKALFTSVPLKKIIEVTQRLLEEDNTLKDRTNMSISNILSILAFCVKVWGLKRPQKTINVSIF